MTTSTHMSTQALFHPFESEKLALPNRIVMAPMTRSFSPGGVPGENVASYYRRRVEGGVGLIVTEGTWVPHEAASNDANVPDFHGEAALRGWSRVVAEVHAAGGKIVPQLWHVGLICPVNRKLEDLDEAYFRNAVSPSGLLDPGRKFGNAMSASDIEAVVQAFAEAAATAQKLGFDGIEIHGAHGYLIDQFFWSGTNHRTDSYGGNISNRTRFGAEIIRACRDAVGPDFPIIFRFSQWKQQDYTARIVESPQELEQFLGFLIDAGVDIFHCSQRRFWEPEFQGSDLSLAGWTRKLGGLPTITVGSVGLDADAVASMVQGDGAGIASLDRVVEMLVRGDFDLVAVGRALITDPNWAAKISLGHFDRLRSFDVAALATLE